MEVLKDSMQPSMSNVVLQWHPPKGYSVVDSSPRNLGTLFSGNSYSAFAFLRRSEPTVNGTHNTLTSGCDVTIPSGTATLTGLVNGEPVEIKVDPIHLPPLSVVQSKEMTALLSQSATWSKLCDLELQALSNSRKNSQNESSEEHSGEPPTKKPRLNGSHGTTAPPAGSPKETPLPDNPLREELIELSLRSGILCPLTYLKSEDDYIQQIVPLPHSSLGKTVKPAHSVHRNGSTALRFRKRKHHSSNHHTLYSSQPNASFTLSSLAKNTFSAIGSTLKTVANITTFGLVGQGSTPVIENGQSLEDEMEYQERRHSQLHWDESKGNIVYPDIYYHSHPDNQHRRDETSDHSRTKRSRRSHSKHTHQSVQMYPSLSTALPTTAQLAEDLLLLDHHLTECAAAENHFVEEEEELTISDTESDSSVDPDWEDLRKPNELLPLIHIQLFSGAWPLVRAFSYAVGVPLEEIRKLPLCKDASDSSTRMNGHTTGGEKNAHLWATALAVACLEEHFSELQSEWEVVAYKGHCWIEHELQYTSLTLDKVQKTARELVQRRS